MKRVLIFSLAYFPKYVGGAEVAIKEKTDRMRDIEFHMVTNRYDSTLPKSERIGNVIVHRIGITRPNASAADLRSYPLHFNKFLFQFLAAWKASRLHRTYRFDCTWAMMAHSCGVPAAIFKLFHPTVPFVLELQEGDPPEKIERTMLPLWPLFVRAFTTADMVSVISTFLGAWAKRRGFTGASVLVPNAVDIGHFSKSESPERIRALRHDFGLRIDDICVMTTSRLVHKNAVDDVIRALPLLPKRVHFVVLGTGPDMPMLGRLASDLGVKERVHFIGQIGHEALPAYLHTSDMFIRPSRSEGMGNSFLEAMAARVPVIATQEGGLADFIFDAKRNPDKETTAWVVDKDSPQQIAEAIQDILANPEAVSRVVETCAQLVAEHYSWDSVARDMRDEVFGKAFEMKLT